MNGFQDNIHIIDGIPIPLCGFTRASQCQSFQGEADYGYCAAKKEKYYGFHGHLMITGTGIITGISLTAANGSQREALWDLVDNIEGLVIGDKGYISEQLEKELDSNGIKLQTPLRKNMKEVRSKSLLRMLMKIRRLIETVIGQLVERFNIEKVWARDTFDLTNRINRKILAHTVCRWLNRKNENPLQFETLVSA